MKLLNRPQIARRVVLFGVLAVAFAVAIVTVELSLSTDNPVTGWTFITAGLGGWALVRAVRWQSADHGEQTEWQPRLFLQTLNGGFSYQAGVIAYFIGNDLTATIVGVVAFVGVLAIVLRNLNTLEFADA